MSNGKIALITGGNKGIGKETARQLGALGYTVLIGARDSARGEAAAGDLRGQGIEAQFLALDVANTASPAIAAEEVRSKYGRLDVLVNNAGVGIDFGVTTSAATSDHWLDTFGVNVFGVVNTTQAFLPLLKESPAGRIVHLTSILGSLAFSADPTSPIGPATGTGTAYAASKAAVNMYTIHLAKELAGTNIKVNAAHPGWVKTDMTGGDDGPAPLYVSDGAKTSVRLATLGEDGPTGGYFHLEDTLPW